MRSYDLTEDNVSVVACKQGRRGATRSPGVRRVIDIDLAISRICFYKRRPLRHAPGHLVPEGHQISTSRFREHFGGLFFGFSSGWIRVPWSI